MTFNERMNDKWFYFPIAILAIAFLYRLIDQSQLLFYFPLDYHNDVSSYMAQLHFLKECGFLNYCSYWYNGFIAFQATSPGWFFFALPFYYLFGDVKTATYFTIILSLAFAFLIIYISGKYFKFSKFQRTAFFLFLFANAHAAGSFIRLGRVHELFAWVWFLAFAFLILHYKDKKFDKKSLLIVLFYSLTTLSYLSVGVIASLLFLCIFLVKPNKERIILVLYFLASLLLMSFWLLPVLHGALSGLGISNMVQGRWLWQFTADNIFTNAAIFALTFILFILFYFYWKHKNKAIKELVFYSPILLFNLIYFFRLTPFIPVFKNIFPDPYITFFLFFALFLFFSTDYDIFKKKIFSFIPYMLIIFALLSVFINVIHTPYFTVPDDKANLELKPLFSNFNGSFLLFGNYPLTIYSKAVYSYAPIYYNLSTPLGWYPEVTTADYLNKFYDITLNDDCDLLSDKLTSFNVTHTIGYTDACEKFDNCSFNLIDRSGDFCLYSIN